MRARTTAVIALLLVLALAAPATALPETAAWGQIPSPNRGQKENELAGLAVAGPNDIWAVGRYNANRPPTVTGRDTLALHWNGSAFSVVSTPNPSWPGADFFSLEDAAAVASDDVWAVGSAQDFASLKSTTLVEHWDGSAWSIVRSPNPGGSTMPNQLNAVDAVASDDLWAVGGAGFPAKALTLRWDGSRWRNVANGCGLASLSGVDAVSATDVWAVGDAVTCHYDGIGWEEIPSPKPRSELGEIAFVLQDVSAAGPNAVWAAGWRVIQFGESYVNEPLVERWDGTEWSLVENAPGSSLYGVVAFGLDDAWIVGTDATRGVVAHWNGSRWSLIPSPSPKGSGVLTAVAAQSSDHLWAAGTSIGRTLVLESPSRFEGTVVGDTRVSGATVSWFGRETGSTETDVGGAYSIAGLQAGTYQLVASYQGCTPATAQVIVTAGQTVTRNLRPTC